MNPNGAVRGDEMVLLGTYAWGSSKLRWDKGLTKNTARLAMSGGWQAGTIHGQPAQSLHDPSVAMAGKDYLAALNAEQRRAA